MDRQKLKNKGFGKLLVFAAVIVLFGSTIVAAAIPAYMEITGRNQGEIEGSVTIAGREGTISIYAFDHEISIPRDLSTGLPTGRRVHSPVVITKEFDKSSPKLYQALTTGETLSDVTIKFYRTGATGAEENYYTVKLEDATISSIKAYYPLTFLEQNQNYKHMEEVSFTYSRITWTWEPDGIESEDTWSTR